MTLNKLIQLLKGIVMITNRERNNSNVLYGYGFNDIANRPKFRIWVNKKGLVTIRTSGKQKSFDIKNENDLFQAFRKMNLK